MGEEKKIRELYQLVAIENDVETVIELKNENKNNRGTLELIDSGTTRFQSKEHLAWYLFKEGKISTTNVEFAIKYNHNGPKYMPVIYNDKELTVLSKNVGYNNIYNDYVFFFLKKIEVALNDPIFYNYIVNINNNRNKRYENGNYINKRLIEVMNEYFNAYVRTGNIDANKADLQYDILKELYQYKQLRTLRSFYLNYIGQKDNRILISPGQQNKK